MSGRFPFPLPNGWFCVAWSDELAPGDVKPIHYFGRELVLFREAGGAARVLDAHCPHLGAHLGHGGRVTGDRLRCPFHAWEWEGATGRCAHIPYAKRIPPRARIGTWPVCEKNGVVMCWRHAEGLPPRWEIPDVPEHADPDWTPFERREWRVRSRNQELAENSVDPAHFRYVHRTDSVPEGDAWIEGHVLRSLSTSLVSTPQGQRESCIDIRAHGFGLGVTRFSGVVDLLVMTCGSPVDDDTVHMRLNFSVRKLESSDATRGVGKAFIAEIERQFAEDIPIWENKIFLERPALCDGDGPIALLRRWARQFYSPVGDEAERTRATG